MLAYSLSACATSYAPKIKAIQESSDEPAAAYLMKEHNGITVMVRPEGSTKDLVGFGVEIINRSDKPISINPTSFYTMAYTTKVDSKVHTVRAINPLDKMAEIDKSIQSRISSGEVGRGLLIFLGIILVVGIIALAVADSANNNNSNNNNSENQPKRTHQENHTHNHEVVRTNYPQRCHNDTKMSALDFIAVTLNATGTGVMRSYQRQETSINLLKKMRDVWEHQTIRKTVLEPNQRVRGTVFFPKFLKKNGQCKLYFPLTFPEHCFLFDYKV